MRLTRCTRCLRAHWPFEGCVQPTTVTTSPLRVGDTTTVEANQGDREATVLAVRGAHVLVEYTMPHGSTALRLLDTTTGGHRPVSYRALPLVWLRAVVQHERGWEGRGQGRRVGTPAEELTRRTFRDPVRCRTCGEFLGDDGCVTIGCDGGVSR